MFRLNGHGWKLIVSPMLTKGTLVVGKQGNFEQHDRRVRRCPRCVIAESHIEAGQVDFVIKQLIQHVFDGAGDGLSLQVNGKKARAGVDVLVSGHVCSIKIVWQFDPDICFGSRHDAFMNRLFLQLR